MTSFDYIIIGSGAGGAAAAWRLAQDGSRILIIEKGESLPKDGSTLDLNQVVRQSRFSSTEAWRTPGGSKVTPKEYFNVGGKTKWFGGALVRFDRDEFEADPTHRCPAWPLAYHEFEPYYSEAERLLGARKFDVEPDLDRIVTRLRKLDGQWQQADLPLGLDPDIRTYPREAQRFDGGFASPRGLKSDAEVKLLAPIKGSSNVTLLSGHEAIALESPDDRPNRIGAVRCANGEVFRAHTVILAAGALHSPRLLQRYADSHQNSAAARLRVGRNYKQHLNTIVLAFGFRRITDVIRKTVLLCHSEYPHSSVQPLGAIDGEVLSARLPGFRSQRLLNALGERAYGLWLTTEDGSSPDNRVTDGLGGQPPTFDYQHSRLPQAVSEHRRLRRRIRFQLLMQGMPSAARKSPLTNTGYACGTMMAGDDPETSVVDSRGRVHGFENLFVADGSVLPRAGRVNTALTVYAWSLRLADLLSGRKARTPSQRITKNRLSKED